MALLVFREKLRAFYGKYDGFVIPLIKFSLSMAVFFLLNSNVGYMARLKSPVILVGLSLACSFLPYGVTSALAGLILVGHISSVSVEMALMAVDGEVYAIERKEEACSLIEKNKRHFGTPNIQVIPGLAPGAMETLPAPTHAFIGGSAGNLREIMECLLRKNPKIRMVINTVTLETIGEVTECLKTLPVLEEEILSVSIAKAKGLGQYHLMMGQNPIYIVTCRGGSL